ncbi:MAG: amidohydrolase family protein [Chloroflexi bacterium]|nr:amidohydrolase family protein [Chloroflexota bacterium]
MIDVNVLVGGSPRVAPAEEYSMQAAARELRGHGAQAALVASRTSASYRVELGNDLVLRAAGIDDGLNLYPVASLNPVQSLDYQSELDRVVASGAVALRLFPDVQGWPVGAVNLAPLRGKRPLLLPVTRFGDAADIGAATEGLDVPVVLLGAHYTQLADCLAALERWPHLYLETSRLAQFRGVDTTVRRVGAQRLLFGSGAPQRPIQAALNAVLTADISAHERDAILGGNASRILGLPQPAPVTLEPARGIGLIDVHGHVGALALPILPIDPRDYAVLAARFGIQQTVASSLRAIVDNAAIGNAEAYAAAACNDALCAYVVVNPNDLAGSCEAMDEAYRHERAIGAKLHCSYTGQPTSGSACVALLDEVAQRGRPLKIHVDGPVWDAALLQVATDYPTWKVIVAHAGPGAPSREAARLVRSAENVYVELSTSFPDLPVVREVVRAAGPDRLLFGSDGPLLDPAYVLGIYADANADLSATPHVAREVFGL